MKRNGSYVGSSVEDKMYQILCDHFGNHNVERQVTIPKTRWAIDFYVRSIDTYVQVDGIYWHGLDRSIKEIAEHKTKRDVVIHNKWLTDRKQDAWFLNTGMRLVRITDKDVKAGNALDKLMGNHD